MGPRMHLRVDERIRAARTDAGNVYVVIDESPWIDIFGSAFDEVGGFLTQPRREFVGLSRESATDLMDETHSIRRGVAAVASSCPASSRSTATFLQRN